MLFYSGVKIFSGEWAPVRLPDTLWLMLEIQNFSCLPMKLKS